MRRGTTSRRRAVGAIAVALCVAASAALGGCATIAGRVAAQSAHTNMEQARTAKLDTGEPRVGDCWRGSYANVQTVDWSGGAPSSCSSDHQFYTYAVQQLKKKYTGSAFDSNQRVDSALLEPAEKLCQQAQENDFGLFSTRDERLRYYTFLPTTVQWAAGARWVRCDFLVLAIGSPVASPALAALPSISAISRSIEYRSSNYDYCVNAPGDDPSQGPYVYNAVLASCSADPEWVYVGRFSVAFPNPSSPYPSAATFATLYSKECQELYTDATHTTFAAYPSTADWMRGQYYASCWVHHR